MDGFLPAGPVAELASGGSLGVPLRRWTHHSHNDDPAGARSVGEGRVQVALAGGRCPIRACTVGDADRGTRDFAIEGHSEPEVLEAFRRGPFRVTHGRFD